MYITVNDVISKMRIDIFYPIQNFDSSKEVAVVSMFGDNIQYEFTVPWMVELELGNKQGIMAGTYTRRELIDFIEWKVELTQFDEKPRINKTNKLAGITKMVLSLEELDNANNLEDGNLATLSLRIT